MLEPNVYRVELDPARTKSIVPMRIRFCETDLMGIVHHANYLLYFEAARVEWLRRRGVTYAEWAAGGIHLPVVEAALAYKAPARFDDEIDVEAQLTELRAASIRFEYRLRRAREVLVTGSTRLACIDGSHAIRRIPEVVNNVLVIGELGT